METQEISTVREPYQPTLEQLNRKENLRRFNRRFIYWPIGIASLIAFSIVLTMVLYIIIAPSTEYLITFSAIADAVIILLSFTIILIISVFLAVAGAVYYQARKNGIAPIRQLQILFWRIEMLTIRIYGSVSEIAPKIARPFIAIGSRLAYIRVLFIGITRIFSRG
jgi:hypothetical protein